MRKLKLFVFAFLGLVLISAITFSCLSDINKAKISLSFLGLHEKNQTRFTEISNYILNDDFERCDSFQDIKDEHKTLLENWCFENRNKNFNIGKKESFETLFAFGDEPWNAGCQPNSERPNMKFEHLYYSDKSIIVCYLSGGIGVSSFFEFYNVKGNELESVGRLNCMSSDIFFLALNLKFDPNMMDWLETKSISLEY